MAIPSPSHRAVMLWIVAIIPLHLVRAQEPMSPPPPGGEAKRSPNGGPNTAPPSDSGTAASTGASVADLNYLFIQTGDTATIKLVNPKDASQGGTLILRQVPRQTTWMTNFPNRQAGRISSTKLSLADEFWETKPTAALVGQLPHETGNGTLVLSILQLADPIYIANDQTMLYNVSVMVSNGYSAPAPRPVQGGYELLDAAGGLKLANMTNSARTPVDLEEVTLYVYFDRCLQSLFEGPCRTDYAVTSGDTSFGPFSWGFGWSY